MAASHPHFQIEIQDLQESAALVKLTGDLDLAAVDSFDEAVGQLADATATVIVDATRLDFIDSTGLRSLLIGRSTVESAGGSFYIVPSDALTRLLEVSGVTDEVDLAVSVEQAIEAMNRGHAT